MNKILMVAVEAKPYATAGGTSDVVGALSKVLQQRGYDVRLALPYYSALIGAPASEIEDLGGFDVPVGRTPVPATVHRADGWAYLIGGQATPDGQARGPAPTRTGDPASYFARAGHGGVPIYPTLENGSVDAGRLYAFYCRAVLELIRQVSADGWQPDVVHCHDWPAGLVPAYAKTALKGAAYLRGVRWAFTVHNLSGTVYQGGWFDPRLLPYARLPRSLYNSGQVQHEGHVNFMKAGIVFSDRVNTVSEGYAAEIRTDRVETFVTCEGRRQRFQYSGGLDGVWSAYNVPLVGIRNGIDDAYDPRCIGEGKEWRLVDVDWQANYAAAAGRPVAEWAYSRDDPQRRRKKQDLKRYLQERCNRLLKTQLAVSDEVPLIAVRSRLTEQKGFDLVVNGLRRWKASHPVQLLIVAWGEERYAAQIRALAAAHPGWIAFSESWQLAPELLHYAGADLLLMPSLFEPCGLPHMMALRYGTIPIVRRTGGLADVVQEFDPTTGTGNGFIFDRPDHTDMLRAVDRALQVYHGRPGLWQELVAGAMQARDRTGQDFTWATAADRYIAELYNDENAGGC